MREILSLKFCNLTYIVKYEYYSFEVLNAKLSNVIYERQNVNLAKI